MQVTVSTAWLSEHLDDVKTLDASWYLPTAARDTFAEFSKQHIVGAQFFDIDLIADTQSHLPHMIPSAECFAYHVERLGVSNSDSIIVYDTAGLFSAARAWWLFQIMGHENVFVLDGGLPKWISDGHSISNAPNTPKRGAFTATLDEAKVVNAAQVLATNSQVIDARPAPRFAGQAAEPRPNTRSGHIPNSMNVFFKSVLTDDGHLKSNSALLETFETIGIDLKKPIITSCGSGVTAAILTLALKQLDHHDNALYDGSWSEWGSRADLPIATS